MHSLSVALNLFLATAAIATPHGEIFKRASCGKGQQSALACIQSAEPASASAFCASYISTKTSTITFKYPQTTYVSVTTTKGTSTVTAGAATITSTISTSGLATSTTTDATSYTSTISETITVGTSTITETSTTTSFTCAGPTTTAVVKRQGVADPATCTSSFASNTISGACANCGAGYPTTTSIVSITLTPTVTKTTSIKTTDTVTVTPTVTAFTTAVSTSTVLQEATLFGETTTTISVTATTTTTATTTVITASATPTAFNLYYVASGAAATTQYAVQRPSPGGSGIMVGFSANAAGASVYHLDANNALADATNSPLATNTVDEYPYLFDAVTGQTAATCSACNDAVTCTSGNMAGGNQFAVCDGFLALGTTFGPDGNGNNACTLVTLQFAAVPTMT